MYLFYLGTHLPFTSFTYLPTYPRSHIPQTTICNQQQQWHTRCIHHSYNHMAPPSLTINYHCHSINFLPSLLTLYWQRIFNRTVTDGYGDLRKAAHIGLRELEQIFRTAAVSAPEHDRAIRTINYREDNHCEQYFGYDFLFNHSILHDNQISYTYAISSLVQGKTVLKTGRKDAMNVRKEKAGSK